MRLERTRRELEHHIVQRVAIGAGTVDDRLGDFRRDVAADAVRLVDHQHLVRLVPLAVDQIAHHLVAREAGQSELVHIGRAGTGMALDHQIGPQGRGRRPPGRDPGLFGRSLVGHGALRERGSARIPKSRFTVNRQIGTDFEPPAFERGGTMNQCS